MVARLVIAAPASSCGKTTIATGLLAAFAARGVRVAPFKVGPDYIDPGYHTLAAGRPGRNLDPVLVGESLIPALFQHGSAGAELAIIEGYLGMFDGRTGAGEFGSTAHVARLLGAPVILVVDATGQGRSIAALVQGFQSFSSVRIAAVILNRVGSARHEHILREACAEVSMPVLGALRRQSAVATPARHLGLVPVVERRAAALETVAALSALIADSVDLGAVHRVARSAPPLTSSSWSPRISNRSTGRLIAVAEGPAFSFGYAETTELIVGAGADVSALDPLWDETLPEDAAGLVVGGGFPEEYAEQLASNVSLRDSVTRLARSGAPIAAECAGLLWLCRSLNGAPMCGVLDADAVMTDRLTVGYRDAEAVSDSVLASAKTRVTGHEFHRTVVHRHGPAAAAWRWVNAEPEGFVVGGVHASYLHLHWAAHPSIPRNLVAACT
jgi:cobyrinic acid a,c-diamide synthase